MTGLTVTQPSTVVPSMQPDNRVHRITTTPIINYLRAKDLDDYVQWHLHMRQGTNKRSIDVAKEVLGPQDYCWNGAWRFWIWERGFTFDIHETAKACTWRLFVSTEGPTLEFTVDQSWTDAVRRKAAGAALKIFLLAWRRGREEANKPPKQYDLHPLRATGPKVKFRNCPPGPFIYEEVIYVRVPKRFGPTHTTGQGRVFPLEWAYELRTGEPFLEYANIKERNNAIVQPLELATER